MATVKAWVEKIPFWLKLVSTIVGMIGAFAGGLFAMYRFTAGDVPALKDSLTTIAAEVRGFRSDLNAMDQRQRAELASNVARQQSSLDRLDASQKAIRAHMVVLIQKVEKRPLNAIEYKDLLTSIRDISTMEAANLTGRSVVTGPEVPEVPKSVNAAYKKGILTSDVWKAFDVTNMEENKPGLDKLLATSFLLKNGKWRATDKSIKFSYDGGSSEFFVKKQVTKIEIDRTVELFNSVSDLGTYAINKDAASSNPPR